MHTIERKGDSKVPLFDEVPPYLKIELADKKQKPYVLEGTFDRQYRYRVSFTTTPPTSPCQGEFFVVDPWDPTRRQRVGLLAMMIEPVRAAPAHLWLTRPTDGGKVEGRFVLLTQQPLPDLTVTIEGEAGGPFKVTRDENNVTAGASTFRVESASLGLKTNDRVDFVVLISWRDGPPGSPFRVPVTLGR